MRSVLVALAIALGTCQAPSQEAVQDPQECPTPPLKPRAPGTPRTEWGRYKPGAPEQCRLEECPTPPLKPRAPGTPRSEWGGPAKPGAPDHC